MQTGSSAHQETPSDSRDTSGNGHAARPTQPSAQPEASPGEATLQAVRMLRRLCRQVIQSETAVRRRCHHEAERLRRLPPAVALRATAVHAEEALKSMPGRGRAEHVPVSIADTLAGTVRSTVQGAIVSRLISSEQAYRDTLLGLRQGVDLVRMLRELARLQSEQALETWCDEWLEQRTPLVVDAEGGLAWFARNSEQATRIARPLKVRLRA
jgi:hypothetical protein